MRGTRIRRLLEVRIYLNNYFPMYTGLTRFPYTCETRITRLLWERNYLNNYFPTYMRLTRSCICVELVSPAYLGKEIT